MTDAAEPESHPSRKRLAIGTGIAFVLIALYALAIALTRPGVPLSQKVNYESITFRVPKSWHVQTGVLVGGFCPTNAVVALESGAPASQHVCPNQAYLSDWLSLELRPMSTTQVGVEQPTVKIGKLAGQKVADNTWDIPNVKVELIVHGTDNKLGSRIIDTFRSTPGGEHD